jgi:TolB-like protein
MLPFTRAPSTLSTLSIGATLVAALGACRTVPGASGPAAVAQAEASARRAVANERTIDAGQIPERTVAVAPLEATATDSIGTIIAYGLSDLLSNDLARSAQLRVVERVRGDAVLRELGLARSGRVDSATAPRVGRLIGARRLVVGSVASRAGRFRVTTRVADVATSAVRPGAQDDASLDEILDAEKRVAFSLFEQLGVALTPAERAAVERRPTRNVAAFLAYGQAVRAEAVGDFRGASRLYQRASALDPSFGEAAAGAARAANVAESRAALGADASALVRAASAVHETVNRPVTAPPVAPPRAADASFPAQQLIQVILNVTVP